ncbi:MAG: cytochrome c oxidase subunit II [Candidatus Promineifilaceae bacterium]|nr:cytochrome c oxidase subunit II [Candidatus Promineifilaceae bacterium]
MSQRLRQQEPTPRSARAQGASGRLLVRRLLPALLALLLAGCSSPNMLTPQGPGAARIADLWWLMCGVGGVVYLLVMAFLLVGLFRPRSGSTYATRPAEGSRTVFWFGAVIPGIILIAMLGATLYTLAALQEPEEAEALTVEVIGHQFWWEVIYPDLGFVTANEIHIPAGQPVRVHMTAADVIHSFWVPELHGKLDMIPGDVTTFWIEADAPGVYYGECAEFCGVQHANMQFLVVADGQAEFEAWVAEQQTPALLPAEGAALDGWRIYQRAGCASCHTVAGTPSSGDVGPDLTHLASRRTLAAATLENNRGNLGGWIINPQSIKPGNLMPPTNLSGPELQALLTFLETLE